MAKKKLIKINTEAFESKHTHCYYFQLEHGKKLKTCVFVGKFWYAKEGRTREMKKNFEMQNIQKLIAFGFEERSAYCLGKMWSDNVLRIRGANGQYRPHYFYLGDIEILKENIFAQYEGEPA